MNTEKFIEETLEDFLLECVGDKVEEVPQLKEMLKDIGYLEDKEALIAQTTHCEILDVDESGAESYSEDGGKIYIDYTLDFIMQTFIDDEIIWRVQGRANAQLSIPDESSDKWAGFDPAKFTPDSEYKKLAEITGVEYEYIECDTIDD